MTLYFPVWLAYVAVVLFACALVFVAWVLCAWLVNEALDKTIKRTKVNAACFAFLMNRVAQREFGTIAEIRKAIDKAEAKARITEKRLQYRENWALYHLHLATHGKVGTPHMVTMEGDEKLAEWSYLGEKSCADMQREFDAWLEGQKAQEVKP